jgi:hypothetical protein
MRIKNIISLDLHISQLNILHIFNKLIQWFPKCGVRPPEGAQEILKESARGAKLFYSLKNK